MAWKNFMKGAEATCANCGKDFLIYTKKMNYIYKMHDQGHLHYLCGWDCYRDFEKKKKGN